MKHADETLAAQYISGEAVTPTMRELMDFTQWIDARFKLIAHWVDFTGDEVTPEDMHAEWDLNARLLISTAHNEHPHWGPEVNAKFRAVHDWDHIQSGCGFDFAGETCVAGYAMSTAPESIRWMLWSEIALQAAAAIHTGEFQTQKLVRV